MTRASMISLTATYLCLMYLPVAYGQQRVAGDSPVGVYRFLEKGFTGEMVISEVPACQVTETLGCLRMSNYKLDITTAQSTGNFSSCEVHAIENSAARVVESATHLMFTLQSQKTIDVTFSKKRASVIDFTTQMRIIVEWADRLLAVG